MVVKCEIGSEFWDVPICNKPCGVWNKSTQWFLFGRSALQAVIKDMRKQKAINTVSIPSWCCHTMIKPFVEADIDVYFYPVYYNGSKLVQQLFLDCDAILLMDYFGYADSECKVVAQKLKKCKSIIIRYVTHSIFSKTYSDADYYFGSLRKWRGVWTGGYAWASDGHSIKHVAEERVVDDKGYVLLREKAMQLKNSCIHGYADENGKIVSDKAYLDIYGKAEKLLETCGILPAWDRDEKLAENFDIEFIRSRRRSNANTLINELCDEPNDDLQSMLMFRSISENDCPMFAPILVLEGRRDRLRQCLIKHDVYCPVHWPLSEYHKLDGRGCFIYDHELSLVCDQRYDAEDMRRMARLIKGFIGNNLENG